MSIQRVRQAFENIFQEIDYNSGPAAGMGEYVIHTQMRGGGSVLSQLLQAKEIRLSKCPPADCISTWSVPKAVMAQIIPDYESIMMQNQSFMKRMGTISELIQAKFPETHALTRVVGLTENGSYLLHVHGKNGKQQSRETLGVDKNLLCIEDYPTYIIRIPEAEMHRALGIPARDRTE